jgi:hypothetical protein
MFDAGLCVVVLLLLLLGRLRDEPVVRRGLLLGACLLAVSLPFSRVNAATETSTLLFFLGIYCTVESQAFRRAGPRRHLLVALQLGAVITLRNSNLLGATVLGAYLYGLPLVRSLVPRKAVLRREALRTLLLVASATLVVLLPWMALSYVWTRSPLFPAFNGNFQPKAGFTFANAGADHPHLLLSYALSNGRAWPLFALATVSAKGSRGRLLGALLATTAVGILGIVFGASEASPLDAGRYTYG